MPTKSLGPVEHTPRGFEIINFKDHYGMRCSLQQSSLAEYSTPGTSAVWLGIEDAEPKVMAREAAAVGVVTKETTGWVPYPVPKQVQLVTRMHLNREQALQVAASLLTWLQTGSLQPKPKRSLLSRLKQLIAN